jgi:hypothetical protein
MKNQYASQLQAKKMLEKAEMIRFAVDRTLDFVLIALNEEYHFGPERLSRVSERVNSLWDEYSELTKDGYEYADAKVQQRIEKITRKEGADDKPREETIS